MSPGRLVPRRLPVAAVSVVASPHRRPRCNRRSPVWCRFGCCRRVIEASARSRVLQCAVSPGLPLLVGSAVAGPQLDRCPRGEAVALHLQAHAKHPHGAIGLNRPALVGVAVARPDTYQGAVGGLRPRVVQAQRGDPRHKRPGRRCPPLVGARAARPDVQRRRRAQLPAAERSRARALYWAPRPSSASPVRPRVCPEITPSGRDKPDCPNLFR